MQSLAIDAQRMSLLFEYGAVTGNDIVAWADSLIVKLDSPPEALLELSTTSLEKTGDIISHLHQLSSGADLWAALRNAIPQIRNFIIAQPGQAESIAGHLCLTACYNHNKVPKDFLSSMFSFDEAFFQARNGISLDAHEAVYQDFLRELDKVVLEV